MAHFAGMMAHLYRSIHLNEIIKLSTGTELNHTPFKYPTFMESIIMQQGIDLTYVVIYFTWQTLTAKTQLQL